MIYHKLKWNVVVQLFYNYVVTKVAGIVVEFTILVGFYC